VRGGMQRIVMSRRFTLRWMSALRRDSKRSEEYNLGTRFHSSL
jgi:hypothetical protein